MIKLDKYFGEGTIGKGKGRNRLLEKIKVAITGSSEWVLLSVEDKQGIRNHNIKYS